MAPFSIVWLIAGVATNAAAKQTETQTLLCFFIILADSSRKV
jgi:hypothetical protein